MNKIKVLLIGPASPHLVNHYNRISKDLFDVKVISNEKGYFNEGIDIQCLNFSLKSLSALFFTPKAIKEITEEYKPAVVHVHQANTYGFYTVIALRKLKTPLILTAWGSDILINPKDSYFLDKMVKYMLKRVDFCTSDSKFMAEEMRKLVPEHELDIEICNFGVKELDLPEVRKEKIIYSNRNHANLYNIDKVINIFQTFLEQSEDKSWKLVIAGKGSNTQKLKELVGKLNLNSNVEFIGFVNEEENIRNYGRAKYFISIPNSDATAMSLLEAMYYKCIPIVSDLPANREWIEDNVTGIIENDTDKNVIQRALSINFEKAAVDNHLKIKREGTVEVSEKKFNNLLLKAVK